MEEKKPLDDFDVPEGKVRTVDGKIIDRQRLVSYWSSILRIRRYSGPQIIRYIIGVRVGLSEGSITRSCLRQRERLRRGGGITPPKLPIRV